MQSCAICGRGTETGIRLMDKRICLVCENITCRLRPDHPFYAYWVRRVRAVLFCEADA